MANKKSSKNKGPAPLNKSLLFKGWFGKYGFKKAGRLGMDIKFEGPVSEIPEELKEDAKRNLDEEHKFCIIYREKDPNA